MTGAAPVDRVVLVKLQPNQDVTQALEQAARICGFASAHILGAVGSVVEAVLDHDGQELRIPGPGQEIACLSGAIKPTGGSRLSGYVCCVDTSVVGGTLVYGRNAVGVTFEVLLAGQA
ncbi:putative DNA-binding protein with PD1-like motif [Novosphingobium capsulatum]|uniref:DNA-binding protein with PD1-like motif n=1 Tax=Novosphingobium capsulatum TaxID=13688 RepID=A0ABU1MMK0_9SPHN|nr:DUF296 domain-containing protein [Novosphingobium capsulatum]MDR6511555.1 putative DNA-binding protein with PD1-like motif [Novosphingobium capsulatum]